MAGVGQLPVFSFKVINADEVFVAFGGLARAIKDWQPYRTS